MSCSVLLLEGAVKDIEAVYRYIRTSNNKTAARNMVASLRKVSESLSDHTERGHVPQEVSKIGRFGYRQIVLEKYRIIYQVAAPNVFIFGIIHGSRDVGEVLRQRMYF